MKIEQFLCALVLFCMIGCSEESSDTDNIYQEEDLQRFNVSIEEQELFNLVNNHRTANGMNALFYSPEVYTIAEEHTNFMIQENSVSHYGFEQRATEVADVTNAKHVGENLAKNFPKPQQALNGWLNSDSHKRTLMGAYTHTIICVRADDKEKLFYTQIFIRK